MDSLSSLHLHLRAVMLAPALSFLFLFALSESVRAQDAPGQTPNWQSPVASPGGPYVGLTGQNIPLDGGNSWSWEGPIIYYHWDFGDGTSGTGPKKLIISTLPMEFTRCH